MPQDIQINTIEDLESYIKARRDTIAKRRAFDPGNRNNINGQVYAFNECLTVIGVLLKNIHHEEEEGD